MNVPESASAAPDREGPATAADLHAALSELDALVHQLETASADRVRAALPELERRIDHARALSEVFLRALRLWADPRTQDTIRSLNEELASGEPLATIPVDQAIADLQRRLGDDDA